ncbi:hypothetical protein SAMN02745117_01405 [Lampropedia hyalina DSM 16112]|uniref:Uncharacterized protein n=1 Tax=Lampropedia hyalina DSM 16112 TaxID=1122156 RepID=A0A1M4Z787_9BURK|nr:hypothetical protein SAMN02745117_01405 [Lampropedia hyalina DSM 16112]
MQPGTDNCRIFRERQYPPSKTAAYIFKPSPDGLTLWRMPIFQKLDPNLNL